MCSKFNFSSQDGHKLEGLVHRVTDGLKSNKYKEVNYDQLKAELSEKRFGSIKTCMKLAKIEKKAQRHRDNSCVKQHQLLWKQEFLRLQQIRKKTEADLGTQMKDKRVSESCGQIYKDFDYYAARLSSDFEEFRKATTGPLWILRDDVRYWMIENRDELKLGSPDVIQKHAEIRQEISRVKSQEQEVLKSLNHEQKKLEAELNTNQLLELFPPVTSRHHVVTEGIPREIMELACPDSQLKSDVLSEFIIVDDKYKSLMTDLTRRYTLALNYDEFGGWHPDDHFLFVTVYGQYPSSTPNHRSLLLDRLKRHLPSKSQKDLIQHEDWWLDFKHYHERWKDLTTDWARHRQELVHKAHAVFTEAAVAYELEEVRNEYCHHQKQLCQVLYDKVKEWRERKMEMMQLEMQLNEEQRRQLEEFEAAEKESERRRREREKESLSQYHDAKETQRRQSQEAAEKKLQELKRQIDEQSVRDRERIKFREEQLSNKLEEKRRKEEEKLKENDELEARLEALRAQVRVIAERDPWRTIQGTKAWDAHHKDEDDDVSLMAPLFKVNGYTSNQITSDHRVKLELRLREAGLHTTDYARQVIRAATPPKPPCPHLQHTFRFGDQ